MLAAVVSTNSVAYGPRQVGAGAADDSSAQTYDLFLPDVPERLPQEVPFFLFIHGGAWMAGSKSDGAAFAREMAKRGFLCASMNYALCPPESGTASFADMMSDIDAMVSHIPAIYSALRRKPPAKIAIGGMSAGGHLALLYAYDGANPKVLSIGLRHAVGIGCVYSDCGPTDLSSDEFEIAGLDGFKGDRDGRAAWFSVLAGGGRDETEKKSLRARLRKYSPAALVVPGSPPTIAIYGETRRVKGTRVGTDGIVARQNYDALTNALVKCGVEHSAKLLGYPHCQALARDPKLLPWLCDETRRMLSGGKAKTVSRQVSRKGKR